MSFLLRLLLASVFATSCAFAAQDKGGSGGRSGSNSTTSSRSDSGNTGGSKSPSSTSATNANSNLATDPNYRLSPGDTISITIGTPNNPVEASTVYTISATGEVRVPWIQDDQKLAEKPVREAERFLENLYKERKMIKRPVVSVKVTDYYPQEVNVIGAVRSPGPLRFPPNTVSLDIGDVITKVGGFTQLARASQVTVTRRDASGKETTFPPLDLESLLTGRTKSGKGRAEFPIYPGDRIFVPETVF
jgi:protein involved in polysaccharide export with SLBB domain